MIAGVNINASCMIIPLGVVIYCSFGGLKVSLQYWNPFERNTIDLN